MTSLAPATGNYEVDRQRHVRAMIERFPAEVAAVGASRHEMLATQSTRLRSMVAHAKANSPWHSPRLANIDPVKLTIERLRAIPPMTKSDMMTNWDELVCDRSLTLELANKHLAHIHDHGPQYLLDEYHIIATGGSTGHRAVVAWDFEGFLMSCTRQVACGQWASANGFPGPSLPHRLGNTASHNPVHLGGAISACFRNDTLLQIVSAPATLPIAEIISRLQAFKPNALAGYASLVHELALRKASGQLDIDPQAVLVAGEPLLPEASTAIKAAFGNCLTNAWGASEIGVSAESRSDRDEMFVSEDLVVIEPVDHAYNPVPFGERCAKILVTNLINKVMPLIRYEITDEMILLPHDPADPWAGVRIKEIAGRTDDPFRYGDGTFVHPHAIRSALTREAAVAEYQVRQTPKGAHAILVAPSSFDLQPVTRALIEAFETAGLNDPHVIVEAVPHIARHADSGKLKRFVPL